jgi:ABC-type transport system involved in cytochrome c biogenesis permease subunit
MVIMQRPPVSTLYESIIFVGFIAVLMCVILELIRRNGIGIFSGTILGTILHFVGFSYADDGDTMGMLVAVLDSNFWLATHVVTITMGYGATVVAGLVGHLYLIKAILHPQKKSDLQEIHKNAVGLSLVALLFTTLGTILGGIWADQSWGRFWGWDPKENGAMLIVLWLLMLLHGRISGIAKPLGFNAGLVLGNIIVALAWFGVNLLGVGLHSYGFTDSIAMNLAIFCGIEVLLAAVGYFWANARVSSTKPAEKAVTT